MRKMIELVKPRGKIATIVAFKDKQDLIYLKIKVSHLHMNICTHDHYMRTEDMQRHHELLSDITDKIESGKYKPTVNKVLQGLTVDNLYEAHKQLESHSMVGKLVIQVAGIRPNRINVKLPFI
ncbi:zinc-binding dehydrogenase [Staphylococcus gallinarum]|uniref:Zinc-binding dehydrogenase n=1 Tax=Staphylococcus gallinarum TaxID=1293 RepID=A0A380FK93_STAGA|nr:zinc-binding dehydrogenase [Staphylococcus gallinarum]